MPESASLTCSQRIARLQPPARKPVRAVLDTDTYNEVDDQFALAYAVLARETLTLEAVYAAPFHNNRSSGPADGMIRSYEEILRVLERLGRNGEGWVYKGSERYLGGTDTPVDSPAARDLIQRALLLPGDESLYVLTIGAPTNVASALLLEPRIAHRIVIVWLGGQPHDWHTAREFNLMQDPPASKTLFDSGVPLVQVPCTNVAEHLRTTIPELDAWLRGRSPLGDYLCDIVRGYHKDPFAWSKVIWDVSAVAWLVQPDWVPTTLVHAPILTDQLTYSRDDRRPFLRVATHCNRDAIFRDIFTRFAQQ
ncbi:MAG: nucleoside hydrolase [Lentisphaeria bacterium]|nr:nucleoside hydrolase [Lentisphaeria bacterium]